MIMLEKIKAIKTTILGVITILVSALTLFGVFSPEVSADLGDATITLMDAVIAVIIAASGVINIFRAD